MKQQCLGGLLVIALLVMGSTVHATDFPLTIDHKFGSTTLQKKPLRVASIDYAGADNILAFGLQPLTVRYWFGEYDNGVWPWAQTKLTTEPAVIRGGLDYEQIAGTKPDVIIAIRSGISKAEYRKLSKIAPVIAVPKGVGDYALTWEERARLVGKVLGKSSQADEMISDVKQQLANVEASHPDWQGKTFAMATYWSGSVGVYSSEDTSVGLIRSMGLTVAPDVQAMSKPGEYYFTLSEERLPMIDTDVLFWYTSEKSAEQINALKMRPLMRAFKTGREIMLPENSIRSGALSHGSLLALPEAIRQIVPMIERAIDGDPATVVSDINL